MCGIAAKKALLPRDGPFRVSRSGSCSCQVIEDPVRRVPASEVSEIRVPWSLHPPVALWPCLMDERVQVVPNTDGGATFLRKKEIVLVAKLLMELNLYCGEIPALFGENRLLFLLADERGNPVKKGLYVSHQSINQDLILRLRSLRNSEPLDFPKNPKSV